MRLVSSLAACLAACLLLPACSSGPKLVKVAGTLTYKQKPPPVGKGGATVVLRPVAEKGQQAERSYAAVYQSATGTFDVPGKNGDGIPEGKYRISVQFMAIPLPPLLKGLNEQFGAQNSPIVRDITGDTQLNIELTKPNG